MCYRMEQCAGRACEFADPVFSMFYSCFQKKMHKPKKEVTLEVIEEECEAAQKSIAEV